MMELLPFLNFDLFVGALNEEMLLLKVIDLLLFPFEKLHFFRL